MQRTCFKRNANKYKSTYIESFDSDVSCSKGLLTQFGFVELTCVLLQRDHCEDTGNIVDVISELSPDDIPLPSKAHPGLYIPLILARLWRAFFYLHL